MKKSCLRLIGDVHGRISNYIHLAKEAEYSIQLGDLGFDYSELNNISSETHKVLAGNHDNYEKHGDKFIKQTSHFLGDFGIHSTPFGNYFFVRGGHSIDLMQRTPGLDWWADEQISHQQAIQCLNLYEKNKPDFVISHECPESIVDQVSTLTQYNGESIKPSFTCKLLQQLLEIHRPSVWFFGHHHRKWLKIIKNTEFHCLDELDFCDIHDLGER